MLSFLRCFPFFDRIFLSRVIRRGKRQRFESEWLPGSSSNSIGSSAEHVPAAADCSCKGLVHEREEMKVKFNSNHGYGLLGIHLDL